MKRYQILLLGTLAIFAVPSETPPAGAAPVPRVTLTEFTVRELTDEGQEGAVLSSDAAAKLRQEATARAGRTVRAQRFALSVEPMAAESPRADAPVLTGTVWVPSPLPPDAIGRRGYFRPGTFVRATAEWRDANGRVQQATARLRWRDVWWTRGGRMQRARPTEDVLRDAVRKVVDAAVKRLNLNTEANAGARRRTAA